MEDIVLDNEFVEEEIEPVKIYHFDKITKEYLYSSLAESDPEESRIQGKFIPLLDAYSTLVKPPKYKENEIPIYQSHYEEQTLTKQEPVYDENGEILDYQEKSETINVLVENWIVEKDLRKNFYTFDENLQVQEITTIGEIQGIVVPRELGEEIKENPQNYKIENNAVVKKSDEEIEAEKEQKEQDRISKLKMTKRVFALGLQKLGITYSKLKEVISSNEQAQLEWELCVELERSNPLLDLMASCVGITPIQLDEMFKQANGENLENALV